MKKLAISFRAHGKDNGFPKSVLLRSFILSGLLVCQPAVAEISSTDYVERELSSKESIYNKKNDAVVLSSEFGFASLEATPHQWEELTGVFPYPTVNAVRLGFWELESSLKNSNIWEKVSNMAQSLGAPDFFLSDDSYKYPSVVAVKNYAESKLSKSDAAVVKASDFNFDELWFHIVEQSPVNAPYPTVNAVQLGFWNLETAIRNALTGREKTSNKAVGITGDTSDDATKYPTVGAIRNFLGALGTKDAVETTDIADGAITAAKLAVPAVPPECETNDCVLILRNGSMRWLFIAEFDGL